MFKSEKYNIQMRSAWTSAAVLAAVLIYGGICSATLTGRNVASLLKSSNAISNELILQTDLLSHCGLRDVGEECVEQFLSASQNKDPLDADRVQRILQKSNTVENYVIPSLDFPRQLGGRFRFKCPSRSGYYPLVETGVRYYDCSGGVFRLRRCHSGHVFDPEAGFCRMYRETKYIPPPSEYTGFVTVNEFFRQLLRTRFVSPSMKRKRAESSASSSDRYEDDDDDGFGFFSRKVRGLTGGVLNAVSKVLGRKPNGMMASFQGNGWFCVRNPYFRKISQRTVEGCWKEAVRRKARYLSLGPKGCGYSQLPAIFSRQVRCSAKTQNVIKLEYFQDLRNSLHPDFKFQLEAARSADIQWETVDLSDFDMTSRRAQCIGECVQQGHDYARFSHSGCQCGSGGVASTRPRFSGSLRTRGLSPGVTVALHPGSSTSWRCVTSSDEPVQAARVLTDTLEICLNDQLSSQFDNRNFSCADNSRDLLQFDKSLCDMRPRPAYSSVVYRNLDRYRNTTTQQTLVNEYSFSWFSAQHPSVAWSVLPGVTSIEQCVLRCQKRFISVSQEECSCGSLRADEEEQSYWDWINQQPQNDVQLDAGHLFLDRLQNNAPEGWACAEQPLFWPLRAVATFGECMKICKHSQSPYIAFGRDGCRCGSLTGTNQLTGLGMIQCAQQFPQPDNPYSVLDTSVWSKLEHQLTHEGYSLHWISALLDGNIRWARLPGRNVFTDCIATCEDSAGTQIIAFGVDGCFCGLPMLPSLFEISSITNSLRPFTLIDGRSTLRYILALRSAPSIGFLPVSNDWVTVRNTTKQTEDDEQTEAPTWIRVSESRRTERVRKRREDLFRLIQGADEIVELSASGSGAGRVLVKNESTIDLSGINVTTTEQLKQTTTILSENLDLSLSDVAERKEAVTNSNAELNVTTETERTRASVSNGVEINIGRRSEVEMDRVSSLKEGISDYKNIHVVGMQVDGTNERFKIDDSEKLNRTNAKQTNIFLRSIDSNRTHLRTEEGLQKIGTYRSKRRRINTQNSGSTVSVNLRIDGKCYTGSADRSTWVRPSGSSTSQLTPFRCMSACVREDHMYAIRDKNGDCFCATNIHHLGTNTGIKTLTGTCDGRESRAVYTGLQQIRVLGHDIVEGKSPDAIQGVRRSKQQNLTEQFHSEEQLKSKKVTSSLKATHFKTVDETTKTRLTRTHKKSGTVEQHIQSSMQKGFFGSEVRLRLAVDRRVHVHDSVTLEIVQRLRTGTSKRRPVLLSGRSKSSKLKLSDSMGFDGFSL